MTLIQALIPLGWGAAGEDLQREVVAFVGERYVRTCGRPEVVRRGGQRGPVYLAGQKVPMVVRRVRDRHGQVEVQLSTYQALQVPSALDDGLFPPHPGRASVPRVCGLCGGSAGGRIESPTPWSP